MRIVQITSPVEVVEYWPKFREGFEWLAKNTKFNFQEESTLRMLCFLLSQPEKSFIAVALDYEDNIVSFLVAVDATPIFETERVFNIYALMHQPSQIKTTRRLINVFELWAVSRGIKQYSLATKKYGKSSISLFSRLGFSRDSLILTKEI